MALTKTELIESLQNEVRILQHLATKVDRASLFGSKYTRGSAVVNVVICGHAAYRAQLFNHLKACGREELNTMNLWAGMDAPVPSA